MLNQLLIDPAAMKWSETRSDSKRIGARIFQLMRMGATVTFSGRKGCVFYSCWSETAMVTPQRCRLLRSKGMRFLGHRLKIFTTDNQCYFYLVRQTIAPFVLCLQCRVEVPCFYRLLWGRIRVCDAARGWLLLALQLGLSFIKRVNTLPCGNAGSGFLFDSEDFLSL